MENNTFNISMFDLKFSLSLIDFSCNLNGHELISLNCTFFEILSYNTLKLIIKIQLKSQHNNMQIHILYLHYIDNNK